MKLHDTRVRYAAQIASRLLLICDISVIDVSKVLSVYGAIALPLNFVI